MEVKLKEQLLISLTTELLRHELSMIEGELQRTFPEGDMASGKKRERILAAISEAYALAKESIEKLGLSRSCAR